MLVTLFANTPSVVIHYPEALHKLSARMNRFPDKVCTWCYNSPLPREHRDIAFYGIKPDLNQVRQPYKNPTDKRIAELIKNGSKGSRLYDWWVVQIVKNVSAEKTAHPCQMPLKVMENIIGILPDNCTIIDPFMGSGTTGVAVKKMNAVQKANRNFIGIEIDEEYYKIAVERIEAADFQLSLMDIY